jgi:branched-chain amino acid transport system substrate-binding protein
MIRHLILVCALVACAAGAGTAQPAPIAIDAIVSLTGTGAFAGKAHQDGIRLYEATANREGGIDGHPVHFEIHDDQSSPAIALQVATAILAKHPSIVIGGTLAQDCSAIVPLFANGPVFLAFSPAFEPPKGGWVFAPIYPAEAGVSALLRYFAGKGLTRIASLASTDTTGQGEERATELALKHPEFRNLRLVASEHFNPTDLSVGAQVAQIKAAAPQALLAWASGTPFGTVVHGLADAGLDVPTATTATNLEVGQLASYATILPHELLAPGDSVLNPNRLPGDPLKASIDEYVSAFKSAGVKPTVLAVISWDPAKIAVAALRRLGPDATPAQVRAYIAGLHGFAGAGGIYDFRSGNQHGLGQSAIVVVRWDPARQTYVLVSQQGGAPLRAGK